jgi:hypothetical protein
MTHTRRNDETWAAIRGDYLLGRSQDDLALHYGVGRSTIRDRARREGWRRCDQPEPPSPPLDRPEPGYDPVPDELMRPPVEVIADAYRRADLALRSGRTAEAQRCLHVARGFERLLLRDDWVSKALNDHWLGEAEARLLRYDPPWPAGVKDADEARAELAAGRLRLEALLTARPFDPVAAHAELDRATRLHACLDLLRERDVALEEHARPLEKDPSAPADPPSSHDARASSGARTNQEPPPAGPLRTDDQTVVLETKSLPVGHRSGVRPPNPPYPPYPPYALGLRPPWSGASGSDPRKDAAGLHRPVAPLGASG